MPAISVSTQSTHSNEPHVNSSLPFALPSLTHLSEDHNVFEHDIQTQHIDQKLNRMQSTINEQKMKIARTSKLVKKLKSHIATLEKECYNTEDNRVSISKLHGEDIRTLRRHTTEIDEIITAKCSRFVLLIKPDVSCYFLFG